MAEKSCTALEPHFAFRRLVAATRQGLRHRSLLHFDGRLQFTVSSVCVAVAVICFRSSRPSHSCPFSCSVLDNDDSSFFQTRARHARHQTQRSRSSEFPETDILTAAHRSCGEGSSSEASGKASTCSSERQSYWESSSELRSMVTQL